MNYTIEYVLNDIVFGCAKGTLLTSERQGLEGVHAVLCAKELQVMLNRQNLVLFESNRPSFEKHNEGKQIVANWAMSQNLEFGLEADISIGVADVLVYGADLGIFEIGTTRPTKMLLLLKYIARQNSPYSVHFWPYGTNKAFVFRNWI